MGIENSHGNGSMFGVVDSMRNMASAMEELLPFLPENFVWPTILTASPFSVYAEWGRDDTEERGKESVWIVATPDGVRMNANFRPDWPDCGASEFDAHVAAEWLQDLTKNWKWDASHYDGRTQSSLSRPSMNS